MRRTCNPGKPVRVWHGAPLFACVARLGKAQRGLSTRPIIERPLVRPQLPGPIFCGQVNRCHAGLISHASGVQLASPQPVSWGESFNGRTAGLQPTNEGSIPSSSTKFAREAVAVKAPV